MEKYRKAFGIRILISFLIFVFSFLSIILYLSFTSSPIHFLKIGERLGMLFTIAISIIILLEAKYYYKQFVFVTENRETYSIEEVKKMSDEIKKNFSMSKWGYIYMAILPALLTLESLSNFNTPEKINWPHFYFNLLLIPALLLSSLIINANKMKYYNTILKNSEEETEKNKNKSAE